MIPKASKLQFLTVISIIVWAPFTPIVHSSEDFAVEETAALLSAIHIIPENDLENDEISGTTVDDENELIGNETNKETQRECYRRYGYDYYGRHDWSQFDLDVNKEDYRIALIIAGTPTTTRSLRRRGFFGFRRFRRRVFGRRVYRQERYDYGRNSGSWIGRSRTGINTGNGMNTNYFRTNRGNWGFIGGTTSTTRQLRYPTQNNLNGNLGPPKAGWNVPSDTSRGDKSDLHGGAGGVNKPKSYIGWNTPRQPGTDSATGVDSGSGSKPKDGWKIPGINKHTRESGSGSESGTGSNKPRPGWVPPGPNPNAGSSNSDTGSNPSAGWVIPGPNTNTGKSGSSSGTDSGSKSPGSWTIPGSNSNSEGTKSGSSSPGGWTVPKSSGSDSTPKNKGNKSGGSSQTKGGSSGGSSKGSSSGGSRGGSRGRGRG